MHCPRSLTLKASAFVLFCLAFSALSLRARAATYNIPDGDVAGLIAAINAANSNPIHLAPGGTYTLTAVAHTDLWPGPSGLPVLFTQLTINGRGATVERSYAPGTPDF